LNSYEFLTGDVLLAINRFWCWFRSRSRRRHFTEFLTKGVVDPVKLSTHLVWSPRKIGLLCVTRVGNCKRYQKFGAVGTRHLEIVHDRLDTSPSPQVFLCRIWSFYPRSARNKWFIASFVTQGHRPNPTRIDLRLPIRDPSNREPICYPFRDKRAAISVENGSFFHPVYFTPRCQSCPWNFTRAERLKKLEWCSCQIVKRCDDVHSFSHSNTGFGKTDRQTGMYTRV